MRYKNNNPGRLQKMVRGKAGGGIKKKPAGIPHTKATDRRPGIPGLYRQYPDAYVDKVDGRDGYHAGRIHTTEGMDRKKKRKEEVKHEKVADRIDCSGFAAGVIAPGRM